MTATASPVHVRAVRRHPNKVDAGPGYAIEKAWRVHGIEDDRFVVLTRHGLTIVDYFGHMLTSWHVGISPGDLARLKLTPTMED